MLYHKSFQVQNSKLEIFLSYGSSLYRIVADFRAVNKSIYYKTIRLGLFNNIGLLFFWSDSRLSLPSIEGRGDEKGPSSAPPSRSNAQCSCKLKHYTHANIVSHLIRPDQAIEIFRSLGWNKQII